VSDEATTSTGSDADPKADDTQTQDKADAQGKTEDKDQDQQNPLGEEQRGFNRAYWEGQRSLSQRIRTHTGPSAAFGHADIGTMYVGDRTQIFIGHELSRTVGAIRQEVLDWIRARYLEVDGHDRMLETLRKRRVVVLRGEPGTGRATTATHLLDTVAEGRVFAMDSSETIKSLTQTGLPEPNAGYLAELSRKVGGSLTDAHLDKLRGLLETAKSFCVLVIESDFQRDDHFGGYAFTCPAPAPRQLLRKHADHEARAEDAPDFDDRLNELLGAAWVSAALGPCPRPLETVRMAALLADHARGKVTKEEVENQAEEAVRYQIGEWFAALQAAPRGDEFTEALHLAAFRVALAVLNGTAYHLVAAAAGLLGARFVAAVGGTGKARTSLFSDDQEARLPALRAKLVDGYATFGRELVPMPELAFHDERYASTILEYVWQTHHRLRAPIGEWLMELGEDLWPMVWVRAAQATGYLCGLDFVYVFTNMIIPCAFSYKRRRWYAAVALDQAAQADQLRPAIREQLRTWRNHKDFQLRWTAAATYGYAYGHQHIEEALRELRILGTPSERHKWEAGGPAVVKIAGRSVAKLLAFGKVTPVLDRLSEWIRSERSSLRMLAVLALDQLIRLYGFELDHLEMSGGGQRPVLPPHADRWPLLLTLQSLDPRLTEPIADLLRRSLQVRAGGPVAEHAGAGRPGDRARAGRGVAGGGDAGAALGRWFRSAEHDAELLDVLTGFLPYLVEWESDARRLSHLVDQMRQDWAQPLRPEVVGRLVEAIEVGKVRSAAR